MTAKTTKTAKVEDITKVTETLTEGAREFVKRSTATAKDRADDLYANSKKYNADLQDALNRAAGGYVNFLGNVADVAYANVNQTIAAAEKLADAKSLSDAMQIQSDFVREQSEATAEHARSAFAQVQDMLSEGTEALRDGYAKLWAAAKPAA